MPRIVHFEIYADDVDRATDFYANLFGWEINKWDGPPQMDYRLVSSGNGPGIDGGITRRPPPESGSAIPGVNYVHVDAIDEYLPKVQANGGSILKPKIPIPGIGYIAICQDTEGNPIGLYQSDPDAAY